ncbi:MAG: EamA family transporter [Actinomycetia bacterium]|nr:EamA family transporter [Actinomycetes bacterium]
MAAALAILASAVFGVADFLGGMSARRIPAAISSLAALGCGLVLLGGAALVVGGSPGQDDLMLGAAAGLVGGAAITAFYFGLSVGSMSVVAPTSAVTSAIVPVVAGLAMGERPGVVAWLGVAVAFPAIALIAREGTADPDVQASEPLEERTTPDGARLGLMAGLAAGAGFGLFVVIVTRTSEDSGLWPLVASRAASVLLVGVVAALTAVWTAEVRASPTLRTGLLLAMAAGVLDGGSNILVLEAGRRGLIVVVGVILALYPASTILLARGVLGERLQRHQVGGLAMAVLAVVLIAV